MWVAEPIIVALLSGFSFYDIGWLFSVRCELRAEKQLRIEHEIKHNTTRWHVNTQFAVEQRVNVIEINHMTATWSVCGTRYWYWNMNPRSASRKEEVWWEKVKQMETQSWHRLHWSSVRGLQRPEKKFENLRNSRFISFETRAKRERVVTRWNPET
jgi:hypothetical protein